MRTKTLLLTAMIGAAGVLSTYAQSTNIYSVNVVGYVTKDIAQNTYVAIANPFTNASLVLGSVLSSAAEGTACYLWNGAGYGIYYYVGGEWLDEGGTPVPSVTLPPGTGCFLFNDSTSFVVTFTGDVIQGNNITVPLGQGFSFVASKVPVAGPLPSLGFPTDDMGIYIWNGVGFTIFYQVGGEWLDEGGTPVAAPNIALAQSFFTYNENSQVDWTREFNVN